MSDAPELVFKEKVIVITGASQGIGKAFALELAKQGAWLSLAARTEEDLQEVANQCELLGAMTQVIPTDVTNETDCKKLITQTVSAFGRIDILVNNAGITMYTYFEEIEDLSIMEKIMSVNFYGAVYCTHYALPHLKKSNGLIVGVSSLTGLNGVPTRTFYSASKHAMRGFFDSLRVELSDTGVDVTMIYPSFVQSEIRKRALNEQGEAIGQSHINESKVMTAEKCAEIMMDAMDKRKRETVMTFTGKIARWLKLIAPSIVDNSAKRAVKK